MTGSPDSRDRRVRLAEPLPKEVDGPMLEHGLQEMHGVRLEVPHSPRFRPRGEFLEERYALLREAEA